MDQPLSSLNFSTDTYQTLRCAGFNYMNEIEQDVITKFINPEEWKEIVYIPSTKTALDVYHENNESGTIYLYDKELDELLDNEMQAGNIIELCGESGTGKTQICFQLCINVQLPKCIGGKEGGTMYICTNYNFSTERLKELCRLTVNKITLMEVSEEKKSIFKNYNVDMIMKNIHHIQINTYDEFLAIVIYFKQWLKFNKISLLVIDSITPIVQQLEYKEKTQFVYKIFADLQKLAFECNFVIIITNNMTLRMKSVGAIYKTASLGEAYYHRINSRISLKKLFENAFSATAEKSVMKNVLPAMFHL